LPARVNQHVSIIRPNPKRIDPRFLRYFLVTPFMQAHMLGYAAAGATRNALTKAMIEGFQIPGTRVDDQRAIASVLGALDDKIDLNRRMNETLEAMARAIFKDWFVDFGPARAKMEGRAPYFAPEIWALFPDRLDAQGNPQGWRLEPLLGVCELKRGYDLPSQNRIAGPVPIISSSGQSGWHQDAMVRGPGIVTGRYGTIGEIFTCQSDFWPLNTTLYVRDFKSRPFWFVYHTLRGLDFAKYSDKAAVPGVNRNALHMEPVITAGPEILTAFNSSVEPLMKLAQENRVEAETLAATRDLLLPKLMSGEIRVRDAEKIVEAAE
jgi:type I restriction enzyme S subunit